MLKASDLITTHKKRSSEHREIYKQFLADCNERIRRANDRGATSVLYTIPAISLGMPLYNAEHAVQYIMRKLTDGNFTTQRVQGTTILVNWDHIFKREMPYKSLARCAQ